jgi:hypothetical protein
MNFPKIFFAFAVNRSALFTEKLSLISVVYLQELFLEFLKLKILLPDLG